MLTGWKVAEAEGRPLEGVFAIVNEFSREPVENPVTRVLREGRIVGLANHTMLISKDGTERPIADSGAPIRNESGAIIGVVLVFHDITERYEMERELHRKTLKLQEADKRKDEFLSMLAHELRNPLAPLTTGVHLLRQSADAPERVLKTAAMMGRQLGHMTRLVDDLLDVARLTRGRIELRKARVPLRDVLAQAVEVSRPLIESRGHQLVFGPVPEVHVDADPTRLVQVFGNLLNNSAKYTPAGGKIWLTSVAEPGSVVAAVRDSGEGMDAALLPNVFDLFTQAHRSLDRSQGGLGIGLTVVRAIVEMHGGDIRAHSAGIGQGSTFEVRLPVADRSLREPGAEPTANLTRNHPAGVRVLVVDDNVDAAESLCSVVSAWGYDVHAACDASDALEKFEAFRPSIILLDIGMPEMDGYALARHFRKSTGSSGVRLVAVTGYGREEDRQLGKNAGFDAFMTKPVDLDQLQLVLLEDGPVR
jgi:PAS domain S-box-containing protein